MVASQNVFKNRNGKGSSSDVHFFYAYNNFQVFRFLMTIEMCCKTENNLMTRLWRWMKSEIILTC